MPYAVGGALALVALAVAGCAGSDATPARLSATAGAEEATVAWVEDGDSLRTESGTRVRLVQIDAPELRTECYGERALGRLRRLAPPGTVITLVRDPALDPTDRYGRELRYVLAGGRNVNVTLVRDGAASPYFFRGARGRYASTLLDAAREARAARRGYWGFCPAAQLDPSRGSVTGRSRRGNP